MPTQRNHTRTRCSILTRPRKLKSKNKYSFFLLIGFLIILTSSCNIRNRTNFHIYTSDKKQCVTIITRGYTRYIINGNSRTVPESNYIKINISKIDPIGDAIYVCWNIEKYEWEITNDQSEVIENKLDTLKYKFNSSFEKDNLGIPILKKYGNPNCAVLDIETMKFIGNSESSILEN